MTTINIQGFYDKRLKRTVRERKKESREKEREREREKEKKFE